MRIDNPDQISIPPDRGSPQAQPQWRKAFPVDWPTDEYRSRREFTKLLGLTSLAFAAGQIWIVLLSVFKRTGRHSAVQISTIAEVPIGGAKLFHYPTKLDPCLLVRLSEEEFVAFGQKCTHLSCPVIPRVAEGVFYCPCHSGVFDLQTGMPMAGPPRRPLPRVTLEVRGGRIFASGVAGGMSV